MSNLTRQNGGERGTAMVVVVALLAIMSFILVINARTLHTLKGEISLVEKRQVQHWATNAPAK